jgi:hypothetical protein
LKLTVEMAGREITCPTCSTGFVIPMRGMPTSARFFSKAATRADVASALHRRPLTAAAIVLLLAIAGVSAVFALTTKTSPTKPAARADLTA